MKTNKILIGLLIMAASTLLTGCNSKSTPVIDAIMARRSVRYYQDKPVSRDILMKIAQCGINAPNAMNKQEWEVRIIDSQDYLNELTTVLQENSPMPMPTDDSRFRNAFRNASAVYAIACPPGSMTYINVGLMSENICLAAQELGLGSCILGGPVAALKSCEQGQAHIKDFGFSDGYDLCLMVAVGYPDEQPAAKPRDINKVQFIDK